MGSVVDHRITRVECKRMKDSIANYKLSYHFDIPKKRIEDKVLKIDYKFFIYYREDVGEIVVEGGLSYKDSPKVLKELEKKWNQNTGAQKKIYNAIYRNAVTMVMDLSRHVGLPPPTLLPEINPGEVS